MRCIHHYLGCDFFFDILFRFICIFRMDLRRCYTQSRLFIIAFEKLNGGFAGTAKKKTGRRKNEQRGWIWIFGGIAQGQDQDIGQGHLQNT